MPVWQREKVKHAWTPVDLFSRDRIERFSRMYALYDSVQTSAQPRLHFEEPIGQLSEASSTSQIATRIVLTIAMAAMTPAVNPFEAQNIEPDIPVAVTPKNLFAAGQPAAVLQESTQEGATCTTSSPASSFPRNNAAAMTPAMNPFATENIKPDIPVAVTPNNLFAAPEQPATVPPKSTRARSTRTTWSPTSNVPQNSTNLPNPRNKNLGLSELSKQLRALQAKNEIQSVEIDRLERQLKILADLQGVSVADLRGTLQRACESEAHNELQQRIASLQAQLEAATLSNPQTLKQDSSSHHVANLELRVGELEEVEENQRKAISRLYESLNQQTAKATRLESTCYQQHCEIERMRQMQEAQQEAQSIPVDTPAVVPVPLQLAAAAAPTTQDIVQYQAPSTAIVASSVDMQLLAETARLAKVEAQVGHEELALLKQQLEAAETEYKLKQAQFKARGMVQDERIEDLEQQLSSLYVAFEMLRQERSEEEETRAALQSCLNEADSQVAQQVDDRDRLSSPWHVEGLHAQETDGVYSTNGVYSSPVSSQPAQFMTTPPLSRHGSMTSPLSNSQHSASSSQQQRRECIMAGPVLVKSNDMLRRWKKRHASLHALLSHFELCLSSTDDSSTKADKVHQLHVGVSTVYKYATQRFAFIVRVDPHDRDAPVIYAAATNEQDYHRWMSALTLATTGNEYNTHDFNTLGSETPMYGTSIERFPSLDEQEASQLEAALRLSIAEK